MGRPEEGGPGLGIVAGLSCAAQAISFDVGDVLIPCSDGVVEACAANRDEEFGEERLARIVGNSCAIDLPRVIERVMVEMRTWSGDGSYADDVTLMLARRCAAAHLQSETVAFK